MHNKIYETVAHTADLQLNFFGATKQELFAHALQGMFTAVQPRYSTDEIHEYTVQVTAANSELLLADFLSEALYLADANGIAFRRAEIVTISDTAVTAKLFGSPILGYAVVEIKAVTYHNLKIRKLHNEWIATVVFDI